MKHIEEFLAAITAAGYRLPAGRTIEADDKFHRLMFGDEKQSSGRYSLKIVTGDFAIGTYGSDKDSGGFKKWHSKAAAETALTREERVAMRQEAERYRQEREKATELKQQRIGVKLEKATRGMALASEDHQYLKNKGVRPHGVLRRAKGNELIVRMYSAQGQLMNVQRIYPNGWKGFWKGAKVLGNCFPIGAYNYLPGAPLVICEGFATGASVHEITGLPVRVAFNTGNLKHVAQALVDKYPEARIVFAADNDQWTFKAGKAIETPAKIAASDPRWEQWQKDGLLYNPGREKADEAALSIGGATVIWPEFDRSQLGSKPTDWNDAAKIHGDDYVRNRILGALQVQEAAQTRIQQETAEEAPLGILESDGSYPEFLDVRAEGGDYRDHDLGDSKPMHGDLGMKFRVLGYNDGLFYYFPFASRQIIALTASGHTMQNLMQLDDLHAWEDKWRVDGKLKIKHQMIALYSADEMMRVAKKRGVFQQEDRVRGCGAWMDEGRVILHCGDSVYEDNRHVSFEELKSHYTYIAASRMITPSDAPLTNHEAARLRKICEAITWENPLSGSLLAGWLVVAQICAALEYRPHVYITGEAESGKSTVMDRIVKPVLGRFALSVDGKTTEPSVRQQMGYDARPLIFDEAEPSASMESVIGLARLASTGGRVKKFGQPIFNARFCACFSAINPPVNKTADESRISFMVIKKNRRSTAMQEYDALLDMIDSTITPDFSNRLIARTLNNMNALLANIKTFQRAARIVTGGARASWQIGTMLAGLYLLGRTDEITPEQAKEWISKHNWDDHTTIDQQGDPIRLVQHLASSLVKPTAGSTEMSIGELIGAAQTTNDAVAHKTLRHYGIVVKDDRVFIASTSHNLARLLRETEWNIKWSRTLGDVQGSLKEKSVYFSRGVRTSAISLPIAIFYDSDEENQPRLNFDREHETEDEEIPF